jgi:hypothetical protein
MADKLLKLKPFYRGDTPLFVVPVTISSATADLTGYTGYLTFTTSDNPATNAGAFLHTEMTTSTGDTLGLGYSGYFFYQFTNEDTEQFDPNSIYYWDVQINKAPQDTNNFTIAAGTFQPKTDYSRGLN